jgi:hypothetical protein
LSFTTSEETFVYRWGGEDQIDSTLFLARESGAPQQ